MNSIVQQMQPYLTLLNAVLTTAGLGALISLAAFARQAERSRADAIEEGRNNAIKDRERTERWAERNETELKAKNEELRQQLEKAGLTVESLAGGASLSGATAEFRLLLERLTERVEIAVSSKPQADPEASIQLAKSYAAQGKWALAAQRLDAYVAHEPADFDIQLMRGVAHSNSRQNDTMALRAYNEAIVRINSQPDFSLRARAFIHRGAIFKRLDRLKEAENDILMGQQMATAGTYEAADAAYNLAAVYALQGKKKQMLEALSEIPPHHDHWRFVKSHLHDYFRMYARDPEFLSLL